MYNFVVDYFMFNEINLIYENLFSMPLCECLAQHTASLYLTWHFSLSFTPYFQQSSLFDKDLYSGTITNVRKNVSNYFDVKATLAPKNYKTVQDVEI